MMFTGWRATALVLTALVVVALLLTALFWLGVLIAALAVVAWFNIFLLPSIAWRIHIPQLVLAAALLPIAAGAGLGLAGTGGLVAGCVIWVLGVAAPRVLLWRLRHRLKRSRILPAQWTLQAYEPTYAREQRERDLLLEEKQN